jgi:esterase/lipase
MEHANADKAIVLLHGLTDSPYFMTAIGEHFYTKLGYNVYLPLLHFHGLKDPQGMEGVDLNQWKANVDFAVEAASANARSVSIGGLSTGGTLSYYTAVSNPKVNGAIYLFSAALDLSGGLFGDFKEWVLRIPWIKIIGDSKKPLIGDNPYRYDRMDIDGAAELAELIKETDVISKRFDRKNPFDKYVFAAHSECDVTADIDGIEDLKKVTNPEKFEFYRIPRSLDVSHANVVLKDSIINPGNQVEVLEKANPDFQNMMDAISVFENRI